MANVRLIRAILLSLVLLLSLSLAGCSVFETVGGWISNGYDNTVAYFNAYYNAKTLFDEAEAEVLAARSAMKSKPAASFASTSGYPGASAFPGSTGYPNSQSFPSSPAFPSNPSPQTYQSPATQQTSSSAKQKFASVIDKCSNILSFYPKSSVVDDALFLIGKSFYYQDDFVRAERKFSELIVQDPNGPLSLAAQLWLLKSLKHLFRFDDANRVGNELVDAATKAEKNEIAGEAFEILGDVAIAQKKPEAALELYAKSVAVADDGPIRSSAQSKIGDTFVSKEEYEKAASAYVDVSRYSPEPYSLYSSRLQAAMSYRRVAKYETAIEVLKNLESDYRFMDFLGNIRFELAMTYAASQKYDAAVDLYRLVDTTYARTEQGARAAFELGRLLQLHIGDYASAKIAFTHAAVGGPPDLTQEAQRRGVAFEKYFRLSDQFAKLDSIFFIIDIDSLWMRVDSSALISKNRKVDSAAAVRRDTVRASGDFDPGRNDKGVVVPAIDSTAVRKLTVSADTLPAQLTLILVKPRKDTLVASLGNLSYQLGELFYTDLDVPDSAFFWLSQAMKLGVDSVKSVRALFVLAEVARGNHERKFGDEKNLYRQIVAKYPKSSYAEEARIALGFAPTPKKEDPAAAMFAVADSLMYAGKYQAAINSLSSIVRSYPESPMTPKSRYTMAWIYENNLANPDSALSQYKVLSVKHATTKYGDAAQRRIPPVVVDTTKKVVVDTTKKSVSDTAVHTQSLGSRKPTADSTMKLLMKKPVSPDSLSDFDNRPMRRVLPKDSVNARKTNKEVID